MRRASNDGLKPAVSLRLASIVFVLSVVAASAVAAGYLAREREKADELRDNRGGAMTVSVEALIDSTFGHARAFAGLFAASQEVDRQEFRAFAGSVGYSPGMFGMGLVRAVPHSDLEAFETRLRSEIPDAFVFEVEGIEQVPADPRPTHYVIDYFFSKDDLPAWGFDAASESNLAGVIEKALATGEPVASGFLTFPATFQPDGFFVLWPAVDGAGETVGVIALAMDLSDMLDAARPNSFSDEVTVTVTDLNADDTPAAPQAWSAVVPVADHDWRVDVVSSEPLRGTWYAVGIILVATLLVFLVTMSVVLVVARRRQRREVEGLREADRQKDDFLATVSHELRTPLTSIIGFSDALLHHGEEIEGETAEMVSFIADEAGAMEGIVQDLLVASRLQQENLVPISIAVIPSVADETRSLADHMVAARNAQVEVRGDAAVLADAARVRQIIRNLIDNASRHGRPPLTIEIDEGVTFVTVAVSDSGPGVDPAMASQLFDRYRSGPNPDGLPSSTGIGLWLSRELAELMGGSLTHAGGSTFVLKLPKAFVEGPVEQVPVAVPGR